MDPDRPHYFYIGKLKEFYENGTYCDIQISVGAEIFTCHRPILAAAFEYFDNKFNGSLGRGEVEKFYFGDAGLNELAVDELLYFAYTGDVFRIDPDAHAMLKACDVLQIRSSSVEDATIKYVQLIDDENKPLCKALSLLELAENTERTTLVQFMKQHILKHLNHFFLEDDDFLTTSYARLKVMLARKFIPPSNRDLLANAILRWVNYCAEERTIHFEELLGQLKEDLPTASLESMTRKFEQLYVIPPTFTIYVECSWRRKVIRQFRREVDTAWREATPVTTLPAVNVMKHCKLRDKLYRLTFSETACFQQVFRAWPSLYSVGKCIGQILKPPPVLMGEFQMCAWQQGQLLYVANQNWPKERLEPRLGIFAYDCATNTWNCIPLMNTAGGFASITSTEDSLYRVGGIGSVGGGRYSYTGIHAYDHRSQQWRKLGKTDGYNWTPYTCFAFDGKVYMAAHDTPVSGTKLNVYDPVADKVGDWIEKLPLADCHFVPFDRGLHAIGMERKMRNIPVEMYYAPAQGKWLPSPISPDFATTAEHIKPHSYSIKDALIL